MMNLKKINAILGKLVEASAPTISSSEITIGNGVETPFGIRVDKDSNGNFIKVTLYEEIEDAPRDAFGMPFEIIYKTFIIGPDRTLYMFDSSDGKVSYYKPVSFGCFTATEVVYINNIMNLVEGGDE